MVLDTHIKKAITSRLAFISCCVMLLLLDSAPESRLNKFESRRTSSVGGKLSGITLFVGED